jgi:hypothetical protein
MATTQPRPRPDGLISAAAATAITTGSTTNVDCDHRDECESLSNDANPDRHAGEIETEHDGGEDDGGHHGGGSGGRKRRQQRRRAARRAHLHRADVALIPGPSP